MELLALLSNDEQTWTQVNALIKHGEWDKIIIIGDSNARKFSSEKQFDFVQIDLTKKIVELKQEFLYKLKDKFEGMEVALSIASGNGKEHMALVSALLSIPIGVRFTAFTKDGVVFM